MLLVTTLSYDQFGQFIRDKQISLDNSNLIFGYRYDIIHKYLQDRLGSEGYIMGIRGRINNKSVALLSQLDAGLTGDRLIMEVNVDDDDVLSFGVQGLEDAVKIMTMGLPEEMVYDQLDASLLEKGNGTPVEVVCAPMVTRSTGIRITSLNREVVLDVDGITFVRMGG